MRKHTFTIFNHDDKAHGYLFGVTRMEAQTVVSKMNDGLDPQDKFYYMEGYFD